MARPWLGDDGNDFDTDDDEFDALTITEWLEVRDFEPTPLVPVAAANPSPVEWAHENDAAWAMVELPANMTAAQARSLMVAAVEKQEQAARDEDHPWATEERKNPYHDKHGKFAPKLGPMSAGTAAHPPAKRIRRSALSNPNTPRTRKVTNEEFQSLASKGRTTLAGMRSRAKPAAAITDGARFRKVKDQAWNDTREVWGGSTVDGRTGKFLRGDEDLYALTIKPPGVESVRIPSSATRQEFDAAMDTAAERFGQQLTYEGSHLGVFHDGDLGSIDIDPVTVVSKHSDVEEIGAYSHSVGGAYHFKSGDGYWPPYVDD